MFAVNDGSNASFDNVLHISTFIILIATPRRSRRGFYWRVNNLVI